MLEPAVAGRGTLCYVCGPEALVHEVPGMLREIGIPTERIRVEEWAFRAP
jgi:ferredoxin-NADP reductase